MWNIGTETVPLSTYDFMHGENESFFAPYGDQEIYRYEFKNVKEASFICPAHEELAYVISAEKDREREQITLVTKQPLSEPCISMRILQPAEDIEKYCNGWGEAAFSNVEEQGTEYFYAKERLRTQGDVERVLHALCLPEHGFSCKFDGVSSVAKKDKDVLRRYFREAAYGISELSSEQALYGKRRGLSFCYVAFSGEAKFLNDYAEYVLSFLEHRYPDFQWVGVQ